MFVDRDVPGSINCSPKAAYANCPDLAVLVGTLFVDATTGGDGDTLSNRSSSELLVGIRVPPLEYYQ